MKMNYRSKPGLSGTQLVQLAKSPAHYQYYIKNPIEPTPAMEFGTAAHTMVLETETFKDRYAVFSGEGTRASKEYKEFLAQNPNKSILKLNEMDRILDMVTAIENHTLAKELLLHSPGKNELELYWNDRSVPCKGKLDRYLDSNVIVDYKTAYDASPEAFNHWKAKNLGYYLQAAHYQAYFMQQHMAPAFVFVVQETEAPFAIQVYELDQTSIDLAHEQRNNLLDLYRSCIDNDNWHGYKEEILKL